MKEKGMSRKQVVNAVDTAIHKLSYMENLYRQAKDQAEKMQHTIQRLANDVRALEYKISILDKTASLMIKIVREKNNNYKNLFIKD